MDLFVCHGYVGLEFWLGTFWHIAILKQEEAILLLTNKTLADFQLAYFFYVILQYNIMVCRHCKMGNLDVIVLKQALKPGLFSVDLLLLYSKRSEYYLHH